MESNIDWMEWSRREPSRGKMFGVFIGVLVTHWSKLIHSFTVHFIVCKLFLHFKIKSIRDHSRESTEYNKERKGFI